MKLASWRMHSVLSPLFGVAIIAALGGHSIQSVAAQSNPEFVTISSQPTNVGDAKIGALAYHDSGAYDRDLATVTSAAVRWLTSIAGAVARPALVLDVYENQNLVWPKK